MDGRRQRKKKDKKEYMVEEEKFKPQLLFSPKCNISPTHPLTTHNTSLLSWNSPCVRSSICKVGN